MAIKISGTTIIDDSCNIINAGNVCATTLHGDGSNLTGIGGGVSTCKITSAGCYVVPPSATYVIVKAYGGGGGGSKGGANYPEPGMVQAAGSGGGGGGYVCCTYLACNMSPTYCVTIGAGGAGGDGSSQPPSCLENNPQGRLFSSWKGAPGGSTTFYPTDPTRPAYLLAADCMCAVGGSGAFQNDGYNACGGAGGPGINGMCVCANDGTYRPRANQVSPCLFLTHEDCIYFGTYPGGDIFKTTAIATWYGGIASGVSPSPSTNPMCPAGPGGASIYGGGAGGSYLGENLGPAPNGGTQGKVGNGGGSIFAGGGGGAGGNACTLPGPEGGGFPQAPPSGCFLVPGGGGGGHRVFNDTQGCGLAGTLTNGCPGLCLDLNARGGGTGGHMAHNVAGPVNGRGGAGGCAGGGGGGARYTTQPYPAAQYDSRCGGDGGDGGNGCIEIIAF
jgi:hypothetical protein